MAPSLCAQLHENLLYGNVCVHSFVAHLHLTTEIGKYISPNMLLCISIEDKEVLWGSEDLLKSLKIILCI